VLMLSMRWCKASAQIIPGITASHARHLHEARKASARAMGRGVDKKMTMRVEFSGKCSGVSDFYCNFADRTRNRSF
jgi:hypothetical protein